MAISEETPVPVDMGTSRISMREVTLLIIGLAYAALMFDQGKIALIAGWTAVALWLVAMVRGPRPTPNLTAVYGAGVFLMTFWWPQENWWQVAIPLMWVGIGLILLGLILQMLKRFGGKR